MQSKEKIKQERKQIYNEVVDAFETKYSWLGRQAAEQMLLSAASWNIEKYNDTPMRYRNHLMLAWERGWLKTSIMSKMAKILGDDFCSTIGKVTDAAMRGSVSGGQFMPPKPLKAPIVISTEFGQTDFQDELLNVFLALLEEGKTNISLNKLGSLPDSHKRNIEQRHDGQISFDAENEFGLETSFVFWGATYDPSKLQDDAMRSRFNVVTPEKKLNPEIVKSIDRNSFSLPKTTIKDLRRYLRSDIEVQTDFAPPDHFYEDYALIPRESRDIQAHMACRNWWGLEVNPDIMEEYIKHLKHSRRIATMDDKERIFDLIFDNPTSFENIVQKTGIQKKKVFMILDQLPTNQVPGDGARQWVIWSGDDEDEEDDEGSGLDSFLEGDDE